MPKRIPHTDSQVITGEKTTQNYLEMQKNLGRFYFQDFLARFDLLKKSGRFLEVGPGPGYQTGLVAEKYRPAQIIGLEFSPDMIQVAEKYIEQKGLGQVVRFTNGAVEDTALIEQLGEFDLIYSTFSLHHWQDPVLGLKNLHHCLKPNGVLFIYDFYRGGLFYYLRVKKGIWESIRASYTPQEIADMLQELGITEYQIERKGMYLSTIIRKSAEN